MAEESEAEVKAEESLPRKKGKKKLLLMLVAVLVLLGGAGAAYYFLKIRGRANEAHAAEKKDEHGSAESGEGEVKQVIELQPFIVNLADKDEARYLRVTVSLGVGESEHEEEKADPLFTTKLRNAILGVVTTKTSEEVLTVNGKATLRKEMLEAARAAVKAPQVHTIYITDFIIQM